MTHPDEELRRLWRNLDEPDPASAEEVLMEVHDKARRLSRSVFWRDLREGVAIVLILGTAAATAMAAPGWLPWAGAGALALSCAWVWRGLRAGRRGEPAVGLDAEAWLAEEQQRVEQEITKLETVVRWYVLPLVAGGTAWAIGLTLVLELPLPVKLVVTAFMVAVSGAIFALVGWAVWRLNRIAVERELEPYRDRLARFRVELSG